MPDGTERAVTAAGRDRVRSFVRDYHIFEEDRAPTAAEQKLIADALIDYLFDEERLMGSVKLRADTAFRALADIGRRLPVGARPTIQLIEQCIIDLAARLERREDMNLIMREDCLMLSETIRQLRSARTT
ncbi:hypothetical protein F1C10_11515 [Sphingomonas sp. NBWT7]|uniref:hypothetical protein n=1 Tax=Sphingomonas sp. NBWT7 TaxID=2596913 RepID=UPI001623420D|nr:hypothetical protein [Sphingomonas sp. NBWT7]QNE32512.1 hypothetical protein F1C10_11515 [Sphingomonas sp. NBWT7]